MIWLVLRQNEVTQLESKVNSQSFSTLIGFTELIKIYKSKEVNNSVLYLINQMVGQTLIMVKFSLELIHELLILSELDFVDGPANTCIC